MLREVFSRASALDQPLVERALAWRDGAFAPYFPSNPSLTSTLRRRLVDWALADGGRRREDCIRMGRLNHGTSVLLNHLAFGGRPRAAQLDQLIAIVETATEKLPRCAGMPAIDALRVLGRANNALRTEQLLRILHTPQAGRVSLRSFILARHADVSVYRAALKASPDANLRDVLAKIPDALRDPEIADTLRRSTRPHILLAVLRHSCGGAFSRAFRALLPEEPDKVLHHLEKRLEDVKSDLTQADLVALLRHERQDIRLRAIALLADLPDRPARRARAARRT